MLFDFETVEDCAATVSGIIASGVVPAAVEMMDRGIVVAAERFAHAGYPTDAAAILIVEVDGTRARSRRRRSPWRRRRDRTEPGASGWRWTTTNADLEGAQERVRLGGHDRAYYLHDCVVPGPSSSRCWPASTRSPDGTSWS